MTAEPQARGGDCGGGAERRGATADGHGWAEGGWNDGEVGLGQDAAARRGSGNGTWQRRRAAHRWQEPTDGGEGCHSGAKPLIFNMFMRQQMVAVVRPLLGAERRGVAASGCRQRRAGADRIITKY